MQGMLLVVALLGAEIEPPLTNAEQRMLKGVNDARVAQHLPPLKVDADLQKGTRAHAKWMANAHSMRHASGWTENIAMGQPTPESCIRTWLNSSGHRTNIMRRSAKFIGVAGYVTPAGRIYWCMRVK